LLKLAGREITIDDYERVFDCKRCAAPTLTCQTATAVFA